MKLSDLTDLLGPKQAEAAVWPEIIKSLEATLAKKPKHWPEGLERMLKSSQETKKYSTLKSLEALEKGFPEVKTLIKPTEKYKFETGWSGGSYSPYTNIAEIGIPPIVRKELSTPFIRTLLHESIHGGQGAALKARPQTYRLGSEPFYDELMKNYYSEPMAVALSDEALYRMGLPKALATGRYNQPKYQVPEDVRKQAPAWLDQLLSIIKGSK